MVNRVNINGMNNLPEAIKSKLGIGKFRIKIIQHQDEEIIAKAIQDLDEVNIRLTQLKEDRPKPTEFTER